MSRKAKDDIKARILEYLLTYTDEHGYSPTYMEIAKAVGYNSASTIQRYIAILVSEGKLETRSKRTRTIKTRKRITFDNAKDGHQQRVRLEVEDGGTLYFDCAVAKEENGSMNIEFSGVLDASELKKIVGLLVCCNVVTDETD